MLSLGSTNESYSFTESAVHSMCDELCMMVCRSDGDKIDCVSFPQQVLLPTQVAQFCTICTRLPSNERGSMLRRQLSFHVLALFALPALGHTLADKSKTYGEAHPQLRESTLYPGAVSFIALARLLEDSPVKVKIVHRKKLHFIHRV